MNILLWVLFFIDSIIGLVGAVMIYKGFSDKNGEVLLTGTVITVITSIIGLILMKPIF